MNYRRRDGSACLSLTPSAELGASSLLNRHPPSASSRHTLAFFIIFTIDEDFMDDNICTCFFSLRHDGYLLCFLYLSVTRSHLSVTRFQYVFDLKEETQEGRKEERKKIYLSVSQCHSACSPLLKFQI